MCTTGTWKQLAQYPLQKTTSFQSKENFLHRGILFNKSSISFFLFSLLFQRANKNQLLRLDKQKKILVPSSIHGSNKDVLNECRSQRIFFRINILQNVRPCCREGGRGDGKAWSASRREVKDLQKHLLHKSDAFSTCRVKILCVSLGCSIFGGGTASLCIGQILFEIQVVRWIYLLSANSQVQALKS